MRPKRVYVRKKPASESLNKPRPSPKGELLTEPLPALDPDEHAMWTIIYFRQNVNDGNLRLDRGRFYFATTTHFCPTRDATTDISPIGTTHVLWVRTPTSKES